MKEDQIQKKWLKTIKQIIYNKIFNYYYSKNKFRFKKKFQKPTKMFLRSKNKKRKIFQEKKICKNSKKISKFLNFKKKSF